MTGSGRREYKIQKCKQCVTGWGRVNLRPTNVRCITVSGRNESNAQNRVRHEYDRHM